MVTLSSALPRTSSARGWLPAAEHGGPILVDLLDQLAQEEQVADAAHLLGGPIGLR
jgi:hypothetical protein